MGLVDTVTASPAFVGIVILLNLDFLSDFFGRFWVAPRMGYFSLLRNLFLVFLFLLLIYYICI